MARVVYRFYVGKRMVLGSPTIDCTLYGHTTKVVMANDVSSGTYLPVGTPVYTCSPRNDTSISGCFALQGGVAYEEFSWSPATCAGKPPPASTVGEYLPATDSSVARLVEDDWNETQRVNDEPSASFSGVHVAVSPLGSTSGLPSTVLDRDLAHWFSVEFNLNGNNYVESANPWTHQVFQSSLTVPVQPSDSNTTPPQSPPETEAPPTTVQTPPPPTSDAQTQAFDTARSDWKQGANAISANEGEYWNQAASALHGFTGTPPWNGTETFDQAITQLQQLASLPDAMMTSQQQQEETSDISSLDTFFETPGLYG